MFSATVDAGEREGSEVVLSLPADDHQLLFHDPPVFVDLKGYEYTFQIGRKIRIGYNSNVTSLYLARKQMPGFANLDDAFTLPLL